MTTDKPFPGHHNNPLPFDHSLAVACRASGDTVAMMPPGLGAASCPTCGSTRSDCTTCHGEGYIHWVEPVAKGKEEDLRAAWQRIWGARRRGELLLMEALVEYNAGKVEAAALAEGSAPEEAEAAARAWRAKTDRFYSRHQMNSDGLYLKRRDAEVLRREMRVAGYVREYSGDDAQVEGRTTERSAVEPRILEPKEADRIAPDALTRAPSSSP